MVRPGQDSTVHVHDASSVCITLVRSMNCSVYPQVFSVALVPQVFTLKTNKVSKWSSLIVVIYFHHKSSIVNLLGLEFFGVGKMMFPPLYLHYIHKLYDVVQFQLHLFKIRLRIMTGYTIYISIWTFLWMISSYQ